MTIRSKLITALLLTVTSLGLHAQNLSAIGLWKTIDDNTGKVKSLVRIYAVGDEVRGKVEKVFVEPGAEPNPVCMKCEGDMKDKPVVGMVILYGLKLDGKEYNGGKILDPNNGKVYSSKLTVADGGKTLNMRGYIGTPMFGRTQTWLREE